MPSDIRTNSGTKALRRVQMGPEVTPGTQVPATAIWRGPATLNDLRKVKLPAEDSGVAPGISRAYIPSFDAKIALAPIEATYEQLPYLFEMGALKVGTGVADGAGSGKIYAYPFWTTAANKLTQAKLGIRSFEFGDDLNVQQMPFGFADNIHLTGKQGGTWMMSGDIMGRQAVDIGMLTGTTIAFTGTHTITDSGSGFTAANGFPAAPFMVKVIGTALNDGVYTVTTIVPGTLTVTETTTIEAAGNTVSVYQYFTTLSLPSVTDMPFGNAKLFVDNVGGTLGTTQITNTFLEADITIKTGIVGQPTSDGALPFNHLEFVSEDITAKLTFLLNTKSDAERRLWKGTQGSPNTPPVPRQIRIGTAGAPLTTPGTTYSYFTFLWDMAGIWEVWDGIGDSKGSDIVVATFHARDDPTAALYAKATVVNQVASLP